jgi:asparagine synthase (glutamine-hydrolysing)
MKVTIAALDKHGNRIGAKLLEALKELRVEQPCHFGIVSPHKSILDRSLDLLSRQTPQSSTLIAYASSKPAAKSYEFLQLDDAALVLQGKIYSPVEETALENQLTKEAQHCEATLQTLIKEADGDYMFFMIKNGWIAAGRDPVGVQPLYYGENQDIAALATNRTALWKLGIENPDSFPPGNVAFANRSGFKFKQVKALSFAEPQPITLENAARTLQVLLEESIKRRTRDVKEVAVAFSGGLDSTLVAFLAAKQGLKVNLLHVSMENEAETKEAIAAAEQLNLPLQIHLYKDSDVEKTLQKVVELIEEADPIKASIGLPFYWTAEKAAEAGLRVILAGQGADELFGGYQRYVNEYCKEGSEKVLKTMFDDVVNIHLSNLERDLKITGYHDVELRLPFASFDVAAFAVALPIECKIERKPDTLRKLVLRRVALDVVMPRSVVDKPKKAVQYSTGINDAVKRIAKKRGKSVKEYAEELLRQSKM